MQSSNFDTQNMNIDTHNVDNMEQLIENNNEQLENMNLKFSSKPTLAQTNDTNLLSLLNIPQEFAHLVKRYDETNDLALYHYTTSSVPDIAHVRGVVVTKSTTPKIVAKSFPFTPEIVSTSLVSPDFDPDNACVSKAYEGTVIRVFYYNGVWYLSTHKKINGEMSRWGSPTFGSLFNECWGVLTDNGKPAFDGFLNKDHCYVFMMSHPANALVCVNKNKTLYHIATYDTSGALPRPIVESLESPLLKNVKNPIKEDIKSPDELVAFVNNLNSRDCSGVIVTFKNSPVMYKVINQDYYRKRNVRGNEPNIRLRYLQLERIHGMNTDELRALLPEKNLMFDYVEKNRTRLTNYLCDHYIHKYVNQNVRNLPREEENFLYTVSNLPLLQKLPTKKFLHPTQKEQIKKVIFNYLRNVTHPRDVNEMIKHMLASRKQMFEHKFNN